LHTIYLNLITLWQQRVALFLPIWIILTLVAAFTTAWFVGRAAGAPFQSNRKVPMDLAASPQFGRPPGACLAVALFGLFVVGYGALILAGEDFAWLDNSCFTLFTLQGRNIDPPIEPEAGRFYPLGFQEFNLLRHFGGSIVAYHALPIFQLLAASFFFLTLDDKLKMTARVCLAAFVLMTPGVVIAFGGLIYQERNVVFWLLCLSFFIKRFDRTQSTASAVAATVCAQFMLYYKETAFLLLWGLVAGRLLLRCRNADPPGWDFSRLREKASRLDLCLASLGLVFLLYYGAVMFRHTSLQYAHQQRIPEAQVLLAYLKMDLLAWLFLAVVVGRSCLIWRRRIAPSLLWDGLAYGAAAYFAGFLFLGLVSPYYLAPMDVIAVLYLGRIAVLSWGKMQPGIRVAALLLLFAILFQNVSLSVFREFERKNFIRANAAIAGVVQAQCQARAGNALRLFFPFSSRNLTMEFGAYLSYRGLRVEGAGDESAATNKVVLVSRAMTKDGLLQDDTSIVGHAGRMPEPGDPSQALPADAVSLAETTPFRDRGDLLLSYEPRPRLPRWFDLLARRLDFPRPNSGPIPDRWLNASVTLWTESKKP